MTYTLKELEQLSPKDLVLCESADGWSLHAPGSTDEQIASGDAPYLLCGEGSPTPIDYAGAFALWLAQIAPDVPGRLELAQFWFEQFCGAVPE